MYRNHYPGPHDVDQARTLAGRIKGDSQPIAFVLPKPAPITRHAPQEKQVKMRRITNNIEDTVLLKTCNIRVKKEHVHKAMRHSADAIQVDPRRDLEIDTRPVWLGKVGFRWNLNDAKSFSSEHPAHLGLFQHKGVWALRVPPEKHDEIRSKLCTPKSILHNLPSYYIEENISDLTKTLKWDAEVLPSSRRMRWNGTQFIVKSKHSPTAYSIQMHFGYEHRVLGIRPTQKVQQPIKILPAPPVSIDRKGSGNSAAPKRFAKPMTGSLLLGNEFGKTPVKQLPTDTLASSLDAANLTNEQLQEALSYSSKLPLLQLSRGNSLLQSLT